jgi:hypothetical protein
MLAIYALLSIVQVQEAVGTALDQVAARFEGLI